MVIMASDSPSVMHSISPELASSLLECALERISEDHFDSPWCPDLEYIVWTWAQDFSDGPLPRCEKIFLRGLAARSAGWIQRDPEAGETHSIPLPQWLSAYQAWREAQGACLEKVRHAGICPTRLMVPIPPGQAIRQVRQKLHPLLDGLLLDFWQAKQHGTPAGAEIIGRAISTLAELHDHLERETAGDLRLNRYAATRRTQRRCSGSQEIHQRR